MVVDVKDNRLADPDLHGVSGDYKTKQNKPQLPANRFRFIKSVAFCWEHVCFKEPCARN